MLKKTFCDHIIYVYLSTLYLFHSFYFFYSLFLLLFLSLFTSVIYQPLWQLHQSLCKPFCFLKYKTLFLLSHHFTLCLTLSSIVSTGRPKKWVSKTSRKIKKNTNAEEVAMMLRVIQKCSENLNVCINSRSSKIVKGFTKHAWNWEDCGWIDTAADNQSHPIYLLILLGLQKTLELVYDGVIELLLISFINSNEQNSQKCQFKCFLTQKFGICLKK